MPCIEILCGFARGVFQLQQEEKNGYQDICYCSLSHVFGVYSPEEVY